MVVIIFDLETSGLKQYHDDIMKSGAKILKEDCTFKKLVKQKSGRHVTKKNKQMKGSTNRDIGKNE